MAKTLKIVRITPKHYCYDCVFWHKAAYPSDTYIAKFNNYCTILKKTVCGLTIGKCKKEGHRVNRKDLANE